MGVTDGVNDAWDPLTTGPFVGQTGAWAIGSNALWKAVGSFSIGLCEEGGMPHSITERPQMGRAGIPKGPGSRGHPAHCYSEDSHLPEAIT